MTFINLEIEAVVIPSILFDLEIKRLCLRIFQI